MIDVESTLTELQLKDLDSVRKRFSGAQEMEMATPITAIVNCRKQDSAVIKRIYEEVGDSLFEGFYEGNKFKEYATQFFCWLFNIDYTPKLGINSVSQTGHTPLHVVAGNLELQELLIDDLGAEVNVRDTSSGETPLFNAVVTPFLKAVKHLVKRGAKLKVVNNKGENLLHAVAKDHRPDANRDYINIAKYLIKNGVNPLQKDKSGKTAIDILQEKIETEKKAAKQAGKKESKQYQELLDLFNNKTKFRKQHKSKSSSVIAADDSVGDVEKSTKNQGRGK